MHKPSQIRHLIVAGPRGAYVSPSRGRRHGPTRRHRATQHRTLSTKAGYRAGYSEAADAAAAVGRRGSQTGLPQRRIWQAQGLRLFLPLTPVCRTHVDPLFRFRVDRRRGCGGMETPTRASDRPCQRRQAQGRGRTARWRSAATPYPAYLTRRARSSLISIKRLGRQQLPQIGPRGCPLSATWSGPRDK